LGAGPEEAVMKRLIIIAFFCSILTGKSIMKDQDDQTDTTSSPTQIFIPNVFSFQQTDKDRTSS